MDDFIISESLSPFLLTSLPSLEYPEDINIKNSNDTTKQKTKRTKRGLNEHDENIGDEWESFVDKNICQIVDSHLQPLEGSFSIGSITIETSVRREEDVWLLHKQNKFNIHSSLKGSLLSFLKPGCVPLYILTKENNVVQIEKLGFTIYALKQYGSFLTEEHVQLFYASDKSAPNIDVSNPSGLVSWSKLQFGASTANNAHRGGKSTQQFYRMVINLVAYVAGSTSPCVLLSKISPCLIVRGQNPGRVAKSKAKQEAKSTPPIENIPSNISFPSFNPSPVNIVNTHQIVNSFQSTNVDSSFITNSNDNNNNNNNVWHFTSTDTSSIYHFGNVGVNIAAPTEALSVGGNMLVTGDIVKPSDKRIKKNFDPIDTAASRKNIEKIKLYDYDRLDLSSLDKNKYVRERGVIAQEVQETIPTAVRVAGDVKLGDGTTIPNLLVVNDRLLLLETIGATQEIGHALDRESEHNTKLKGRMEALVDYILVEEEKDKYGGSMKNNCFYFSLWSMGPAWSLFIIGFFFPLFWLFGSNYICSRHHYRRKGGYASCIALFITSGVIAILVWIFVQIEYPFNIIIPVVIFFPCYFGMGIITCGIVAYARGKTLAALDNRKRRMQHTLKNYDV